MMSVTRRGAVVETRWVDDSQVREIEGASIDGAPGARCLLFESEHVMRMVWRFPAAWYELSNEQLMAVSWQR